MLPQYAGTWQGAWRLGACANDGDWVGVCDEQPVGDLFGMTFVLTQARDTVTGTLDVLGGGTTPGAVQGSIRLSGHLGLAGTFIVIVDGLPLEVTISDWETLTTDNARMTGRFWIVFRAAGLQGSVRWEADMQVVTRTASAALSGAGPREQTWRDRLRIPRPRRR